MKGYCVYNKIQQLKAKGFKRATVAKRLNIDRRTVGHKQVGRVFSKYRHTPQPG